MNRFHCLLGLLVAFVLCAPAYGQWRHDGWVEADTDWSKSEDGFSAALLLSDRPDEILESWNSPQGGVVPVRTTETVKRGTPIVAFVFFGGCRADDDGLCDATIDFTILKPDGSVYDQFAGRELWKRRPAPPAGMVRLSAEYVGVVIESADPLGEYTFKVTVHDRLADNRFELTRVFTATEKRLLKSSNWGLLDRF